MPWHRVLGGGGCPRWALEMSDPNCTHGVSQKKELRPLVLISAMQLCNIWPHRCISSSGHFQCLRMNRHILCRADRQTVHTYNLLQIPEVGCKYRKPKRNYSQVVVKGCSQSAQQGHCWEQWGHKQNSPPCFNYRPISTPMSWMGPNGRGSYSLHPVLCPHSASLFCSG